MNQSELVQPNSIGWDIPFDVWLEQFTDSKFCLVIRCDTPHTHALSRSIQAGCIPVIIADLLPTFAPFLPATLDVTDYSIMIKNADFIKDPQGKLMKLHNLTDEYIKEKIEALRFAQHVLVIPNYVDNENHQESLFVQAVLKEADKAMEKKWPIYQWKRNPR